MFRRILSVAPFAFLGSWAVFKKKESEPKPSIIKVHIVKYSLF